MHPLLCHCIIIIIFIFIYICEVRKNRKAQREGWRGALLYTLSFCERLLSFSESSQLGSITCMYIYSIHTTGVHPLHAYMYSCLQPGSIALSVSWGCSYNYHARACWGYYQHTHTSHLPRTRPSSHTLRAILSIGVLAVGESRLLPCTTQR